MWPLIPTRFLAPTARVALSAVVLLSVLASPTRAQAQAAASPAGLALTGVRAFSGPEKTRIVFEFSRTTAFVAPDSGIARQLALSLSGEAVARAPGVPVVLRVRDGVVDSVASDTRVDGAGFRLAFRDSTRFHVASLAAQDGQPFRLVVDVERLGAAQAEAQRLEGIAQVKRRDRVRVVAVDAGHGGEDVGARGPRNVRVLEKDVTLAVARALVTELSGVPGVRAELIRDGDYFIPLRERYLRAEKMKADLFVSIHANASLRPTAAGAAIYVATFDPNKKDLSYGADDSGTLLVIFPVSDLTVMQTNLTMEFEKYMKLETNPKVLPKEGTPVKLILQAVGK